MQFLLSQQLLVTAVPLLILSFAPFGDEYPVGLCRSDSGDD